MTSQRGEQAIAIHILKFGQLIEYNMRNCFICTQFLKKNISLVMFYQPILVQCHISIPPQNVRKTKGFLKFSGGIEI